MEILGINRPDEAAFNVLISPNLPWLQDISTQSVSAAWDVTYRDVRILDSRNRFVVAYNLTEHDLEDPANRDYLKTLFLSTAVVRDADQDFLADDWEAQFFTNNPATNGDRDKDGIGNLTEYAFGTNPNDLLSVPSITPRMITTGLGKNFLVTFRRRAGGVFDYVVETSQDLAAWSPITGEMAVAQPPRNLFDGTGTSEAVVSFTPTGSQQGWKFLRVRAVRR